MINIKDNPLVKLSNKFKTDKGTEKGAAHGYSIDYYSHFKSFQNQPINLLEIGIERGNSLLTWDSFFNHSESKIIGIDNEFDLEKYKFQIPNFSNTKINTYKVDQGNRNQLTKWAQEIGLKFDIIIDDGAHLSKEHQTSLGVLFPLVKSGGFYVIEDLATMYQWESEAKYDKNTLNLIKEFIKNKTFNSEYMTDDEIKYLINNTLNNFLYDDHFQGNIRRDQLWILEKK